MSKNKKIILGLLTVLPIILLFIYIFSILFFFLGSVGKISSNYEPDFNTFVGSFIIMILLVFASIILAIGTMIYYIIHISNNPVLDSNQRLIWILILIFAGLFGNAIYWYMYIWKENTKQSNINL